MIKQLRPGDPLPAGKPRRYLAAHGYVRLRWKVGPGLYVETYEHRVDGDRVTTAEHVHHIDGDRTNNDPSNLERLSADTHADRHRRADVDWESVATGYANGRTLVELGREFGRHHSVVSRRLRAMGVITRQWPDYATTIDPATFRAHYEVARSMGEVRRALGLTRPVAERMRLSLSLPPFPRGGPFDRTGLELMESVGG